MNDKQLAALTDGQKLVQNLVEVLLRGSGRDKVAGHTLRRCLEDLADARLEVVNGLEDGVGWRWRVRDTEKRGLVLERLQLGRRPFWEEVAELAAYQPSAQDARSVRFRALLTRAEKAEAEVAAWKAKMENV